MIVRIFSGPSWAASSEYGDFEFDALPSIGHKIAIATRDGWDSGVVKDIVHRCVRPDDPADIALLVASIMSGSDPSEPLPVHALDAIESGTQAIPSVPRSKPWG